METWPGGFEDWMDVMGWDGMQTEDACLLCSIHVGLKLVASRFKRDMFLEFVTHLTSAPDTGGQAYGFGGHRFRFPIYRTALA